MRSSGWIKRNIRVKKKSTSEELFTSAFTPSIPRVIHVYKKDKGRISCEVSVVKNVLLGVAS